jgi:hypothetical protein
MKGMTMTAETPANVTPIEDLAMSRLLERALAPARARLQAEPSEDAVERMRARVIGETEKKARTLAA